VANPELFLPFLLLFAIFASSSKNYPLEQKPIKSVKETRRGESVTNNKQSLLNKISTHSARIGVIGLGYVGLPLVVEFARGGFDSVGFEVDSRKADTINRGESYIPDVPIRHVAELVAGKKLSATIDFTRLKEQDIIIICVPTPLRKTKDPDVSYILAATEKIQATLRPGQLIILESTTYPGTTDEVLRPMFDETGLKIDEDYFLAFSPERVDPGNEKFNTRNIPKVVGGASPATPLIDEQRSKGKRKN
jgi:UDP-N-acetyl-D-glucosamine dehydrogenase